ncbi:MULTISPECIES: ribonuclease D [Idiomarina]|uniref:ribonuclease D n=1 Tax=Idiomarina TaxID=135575 RepID=UPI00129CB12C|nr:MULTISPECIES: ribonuclease D [Idiomarina]MRJ42324.1 ribonuclease D [Idiomarina sp. FeN1]NCU57449.1 ribonuclease D [Idiomarina sp. FenA--70]NCU60635.1 ribonuclease D [Idiomarina sp. FenBw--71]UUN14806.1 ribonuclease D [Idiomarina loihiensis]
MLPFNLITTAEQLAGFCQQADSASFLAVDTEFVRTRTYYAKLGLIQVRADDLLVLIDPLAVTDLTPLWQLFANQQQPLVIHAGGEDYEILSQHMGQVVTGVFDTQIAAAVAGHGDALGYAALVAHYNQVELDKSQSRTDWLQRPLATEQLDYAAADVFYLHQIYPQLLAELSPEQLAIVLEETALQVQKRAHQDPPHWLYLSFGNAWQCNRQQLAVLRELLQWRLARAQKSDIPLSFVAKDHTLLELARRMPSSIHHLRGVTDLSPVTVRYAGEALLQAISKGAHASEQPASLERLTDMRGYKVVFNELKKRVNEVAAELQLQPSLVASRRQINDVIHWFWQVPAAAQAELMTPDLLTGWRGAKLKAFAEKLLSQHHS